jgi:hypothetical protein
VPEYLQNASQAILNAGKCDDTDELSGPEQMQSAAVRSIKERAGKRQMAKISSRNNFNDGNKSMTMTTPVAYYNPTHTNAAENKEWAAIAAAAAQEEK